MPTEGSPSDDSGDAPRSVPHRPRLPGRAWGPSPAERRWRRRLVAAGYPVAPVAVAVHASIFVAPQGDREAAIEAYVDLLEAEPERLDDYAGLERLLLLLGHREIARDWRRRAHEVRARHSGLEGDELRAAVDDLVAADGEA